MRRGLLTQRGLGLLVAGLTLLAAGVLLGFPDLTRIGLLLVALPALAGLVLGRRQVRLGVDRTARPSRLAVGQQAIVTVQITNSAGHRSPLLVAEEHLEYSLGDRPRFLVPALSPDAQCRLSYPVTPTIRGRHLLGPLEVRVRDPFGLISRPAATAGQAEVTVLPRVVPLAGTPSVGGGTGAEGTVPHMVALHGEDDISLREYREGDDLRRIHWPSTARTGTLMMRAEDRPSRRRAVLLLDARQGAHRGQGRAASFEWAVTALASAGVHLAQSGYAVHLLTPELVTDGREGAALGTDEILDALAVAETREAAPLDAVLHAARPLAPGGGLVVAVVAGCDDAHARALAALRQPGSNGVAVVLDTVPERTASTVAVLAAAGWSCTTARGDVPVDRVWPDLVGRVGSGLR
ncbi:MAG: DUF58 domain-containing protein [Micrococcales bacterium]|nr:DUF58 domain-containing protein [Micrococcales bacterium]